MHLTSLIFPSNVPIKAYEQDLEVIAEGGDGFTCVLLALSEHVRSFKALHGFRPSPSTYAKVIQMVCYSNSNPSLTHL